MSFVALDVVPPTVDAATAAAILEEGWGLTGDLEELGSQQDRNLLVSTADGRRLVLKVANPAFPRVELEAQTAALAHLRAQLARTAPELRVQEVVPALDGALVRPVVVDGIPTIARLATYLEGPLLGETGRVATPVLRAVGRLVATTGAALADLDHPGAHRRSQWDLAHATDVVAALEQRDPSGTTGRLRRHVDAAAHLIEGCADGLPSQPVHADLHAWNLVCSPGADGRWWPTGVIDTGDLTTTWRVADLAIALASQVDLDPEDPLRVVRYVVEGYLEVATLEDAELSVLWPLVCSRAAVDAAAGLHQSRLDPGNGYTATAVDRLLRTVDVVTAVPGALAEAVARDAAGGVARPFRSVAAGVVSGVGRALVPDLADRELELLDLSVTSERWDGVPGWHPEEARVQLERAAAAASGRGCAAVTRWLEAQLPRTLPAGVADEPESVALGSAVLLPAGTAITAPVVATVSAVDRVAGSMRLRPVTSDPDAPDVLLRGLTAVAVEPGATVASGAALGSVAAARSPVDRDRFLPSHLGVQLVARGLTSVPWWVGARDAAAWAVLCPDPSPLLGRDVALSEDPGADALALGMRRDAVLASGQRRYYDRPPRIERGRGAALIDTAGRSYLDVVNNVAAVGHSHPHVTDAVTRQLRRLNTNSRFHYEVVVEYAERLASLLPSHLDRVFLVNSGSEANEVALRLARLATGRRDVLCLRGAYHGWTTATDEVTTEQPRVDRVFEPWVHVVDAPHPLRGRFRDGSASVPAALDEVRRAIEESASSGSGVAAWLSEARLGNAGGVGFPPGYLRGAYELVRAAAGLTIADEVQVGFGRTGEHLWAFEAEGVLPDIVTVAKAAGNGVPVAACITTTGLAERFAAHDAFFASTGGSPLGCAAGLAVLDVLEREELQANAARVGRHLRERLTDLADAHALIGAVHGTGLYLGVELVLDRATMTPATAIAGEVCERLLELGVICQPTGEHGNVLKVKPPLVMTQDQADRFVAALDRTLGEGW